MGKTSSNPATRTRSSIGEEPFVAYRRGALRGVCVEGFESFDLEAIPWDTLKRAPDPDHELAKASRTRRVVRTEFTPPGGRPRAVYAKRVLVLDWRKRLGDLVYPSKARHEWTAGYRLLKMGIATPRPLVCAERWRGPWLLANYLVVEALVNARTLGGELARLESAGERRGLLDDLARWLWWIHRRGFYHDDCSAAHVFVGSPNAVVDGAKGARGVPAAAVGSGAGHPAVSALPGRFWLIDLDNSRFHRGAVPWFRRVRNLFQLLRSIAPGQLARTDRLRFLRAYLAASGEAHRLRGAIRAVRRIARAKGTSVHL